MGSLRPAKTAAGTSPTAALPRPLCYGERRQQRGYLRLSSCRLFFDGRAFNSQRIFSLSAVSRSISVVACLWSHSRFSSTNMRAS